MSSRLAEAKRYVWTELQALMPTDDQCKIYVQHPIGIVTVDGFQIDPDQAKITHAYSETHGDSLFAWCDPETGEREIAANMLTCPGSLKWSDPTIFLVSALKRLQEARQPTDSVIVYATWEECEVKRSDPEPELPPELSLPQPEEARTSCAADIERRKWELSEFTILDDQTKIALHSAWALLDIAKSLRVLASEVRSAEDLEAL
jgi:hypothetical protein